MTKIYNKSKNLAKRIFLRRNQTVQEIILWARLKRNQLGFKCKRQFSVGAYVLDFYFPSKKLAIELDGSQHLENKEYDKERTEYLSVLGIEVLRFWNNEVNDNINGVIDNVMRELDSPSP
jgi:very-short-patch-repair endonuclease